MSGTSNASHDSPLVDAAETWRAFRREWAKTDDYRTLVRLVRRAEAVAAEPEIQRSLLPVRVAILGSATVDLLLPVLRGALLYRGLQPTVHVAPYGQVVTTLLDADNPLLAFAPQVTLIVNTAHQVSSWPQLNATVREVELVVDEVCRGMLEPCAIFHQRTGSEIVLGNFHPLPGRAAGNLGAKMPGDQTNFIRRLNIALGDRAPHYVQINDVASLAEAKGLDTWFDPRYWYLAKQPIAFDCVAAYCRSVAGIVAAAFGRTRKCLVVDLDNTLWGGVIGDDGLSGIAIGEGTAEGEAFKAFQLYLRELRSRGVLLAVCSKNDEAVAKSPFTAHPEMVLRLDDFVAFKANWQPKSENIRTIARELNLALDAFVFVDDNAAERHEVAMAIPEIAVPELPPDAAEFARALDNERLFEVIAVTGEDLTRTAAYQARRQTLDALEGGVDLRGHLASLQMHARIQPFEEVSFERITQLVNKTSQFNLTTRRVVLSEITRMASDPGCLTRTVRLSDRFGDHGLISVLFGRVVNAELLIDAWLMSCRVVGRGVEDLLFNALIAAAPTYCIRRITGFFKPTGRNDLVKDHYKKLGFVKVSDIDGLESWGLDMARAAPRETFITCEDLRPA